MNKVSVGDCVLSVAGRDKGEYFVVISTDGKFVTVVNGRTRKASSPKRKNRKHIRIVCKGKLKDLAEEIVKSPISDKRIRRMIESVKE